LKRSAELPWTRLRRPNLAATNRLTNAERSIPGFRDESLRGGRTMVILRINGKSHTVDVSPDMPLLWVLRDLLGMTGTKFGCGVALCGACTVHLDGIPRRACVMPVGAAIGHAITTIEAVGATPVGKKVQQAWLDLEVVQCGYCQSGQIMAAAALLAKIPAPTDTDIDQAMSGNICRCGTYTRIREAIKHAAQTPSTVKRGG